MKNVQVRDSLMKLSYKQKPLPQPPKKEGISMNVTCYECGQPGHIRTNCPHLMPKVRTVATRAGDTKEPEMNPQEEEVLPPDKQGEGEISEHQEQLDEHMEPQYQWDTEEEEETDNNTVFL